MATAPVFAVACLSSLAAAHAQEPVAWGDELKFHTFSIVAIDPATGEVGVAVTTDPIRPRGRAMMRRSMSTTKPPSRRSTGFAPTRDGRPSVPGYVDARTIERLWGELEDRSLASDMRERLLQVSRWIAERRQSRPEASFEGGA